MIWVNFYSLFCLYGLLPNEQLECWRHFVQASHILSKSQITPNKISIADALLLRFCQRFQCLYGGTVMTANIHMHCHVLEFVKHFGPINIFWLFSFERYNGILEADQQTTVPLNLSFRRNLLKTILTFIS